MGTPERFVSQEALSERIGRYLPSREFLLQYLYPRADEIEKRNKFRKRFPGADYVTVYYHKEGHNVMIPPWHPLNSIPRQIPGIDYGQAVFEGESAEPLVKGGRIIGANLVLFDVRVQRLKSSILSQGFQLPFAVDEIRQAVIDLIAVSGEKILRTPEGHPSRAYVRPSVFRGFGPMGVSISEGQEIDFSTIAWNWPYYLKDPERVYRGSGLRVTLFTNEQRTQRIYAKEAMNYGHTGTVAKRARILGFDESLLFGPYIIDPKTGDMKEEFSLHLRKGIENSVYYRLVISDGPGEEVAAMTPEGELWFPPMNVNRLGGTTLKYITDYIAPKLGIRARERAFCLENILSGEIQNLIVMGNAARLGPVGEVSLLNEKNGVLESFHMTINNSTRQLVESFEGEVSGRLEPSDPQLLTPVDLAEGRKARLILDDTYANWI